MTPEEKAQRVPWVRLEREQPHKNKLPSEQEGEYQGRGGRNHARFTCFLPPDTLPPAP